MNFTQTFDLPDLTGGVPSFVSPYLRLDNAVQRRPFSGELRLPGSPCLAFPSSIALSGVFALQDSPVSGGNRRAPGP